ncbi:MAG: hypothetical protein EB079_07425 [Verrucomicrobia bacterium]|nr:hypothetical protein [Verrucomicrobiota bacterium]
MGDITGTIGERFLPCFLATTVSNLLAFGPFLFGMVPAVALAVGAEGMDWARLAERPALVAAIPDKASRGPAGIKLGIKDA